MKVTICIGSSCHLKGSKIIIEQLQEYIAEDNLQNKIELCGAFCMGNCVNAVSVKINNELFSLQPTDTKKFYNNEVLKRLNDEV